VLRLGKGKGDDTLKPVEPLASGTDLWQNIGGQAIKLFQVPRKISFTFLFNTNSFILDDVKLAELSNNSFERASICSTFYYSCP